MSIKPNIDSKNHHLRLPSLDPEPSFALKVNFEIVSDTVSPKMIDFDMTNYIHKDSYFKIKCYQKQLVYWLVCIEKTGAKKSSKQSVRS